MSYHVAFTETADKQFQKLEKPVQQQIAKYIDKNIEGSSNPRLYGKALKGDLRGLWRYDTGNYRIICDIQDDVCRVLAVKVGHRKDVYK
jgi:mRNA interferase RelE/StbE